MKRLTTLAAILTFILSFSVFSYGQNTTPPTPPVKHGPGFVDLNGDGINDNAPDHDGDGIPNGQDPDYLRNNMNGKGFIDLDGDGINDNMGSGLRSKQGRGRGGFGNGTGFAPANGTGFGPGVNSGNCDFTGPKGQGKRGGRTRSGK